MLLLEFSLDTAKVYFWPGKSAGQIVIGIEVFFAALWLLVLIIHALKLHWATVIARRTDTLIATLSADVLNRPPDRADIENARRVFSSYTASAGIPLRHPVAEHVQTIFAAGYCDSQLETAELLRKTDGQVGRLDGLLRSTIGLFVILGLLGTLFGVADAVAVLAKQAKPDIGSFLEELRGAFAPSLVGVALSVVWVIVYAAVALPLHNRFRVLLRERTVRDWAPRLRPSTSQRLTEAAYHTLEAARKVVEFAAGIEENADRWDRAVDASAQAAERISTAMGEMNATVTSVHAVVDTTLNDMSRKLQDFVAALGEWNSMRLLVAEFKTSVAEFQRQQTDTAVQIRAQAEGVARTTQSLRDELKESLGALERAANSLFTPVQSAAGDLKAIGNAFADTSAELVNGLKTELATQVDKLSSAHKASLGAAAQFFQTMSSELRERAAEVVRQLQNLREPFVDAARELTAASGAASTRWSTQIQDFNRRADNLIAAIREAHAAPPAPFLNEQRWGELMAHLTELRSHAVPFLNEQRWNDLITRLAELRPLGKPVFDEQRWSELMNRLNELQSRLNPQPVVRAITGVVAETEKVRGLLEALSSSLASLSHGREVPFREFTGDRVSTVKPIR